MLKVWLTLVVIDFILGAVGFIGDFYWVKEAFALGVLIVFVVGVANLMTAITPTWEERSKCQHCGEKHDERSNRTCQ